MNINNFNEGELVFLEEHNKKLIRMKWHPVFKEIHSLDDLKLFMQWHVFAVWDFMTLVKRLQQDFTCTSIPWVPPRNVMAARLINHIVLGEESDDIVGKYIGSHFDIYLAAMKEIGANTSQIEKFISLLNSKVSFYDALDIVEAHPKIREFVTTTLELAIHGTTEEVLGSFFYGREDSIPQMFTSLLDSWKIPNETAPILRSYLARHIELDSEDHGPAIKKIIDSEIGHDPSKLQGFFLAGADAIERRIYLWDGLYAQLREMV